MHYKHIVELSKIAVLWRGKGCTARFHQALALRCSGNLQRELHNYAWQTLKKFDGNVENARQNAPNNFYAIARK